MTPLAMSLRRFAHSRPAASPSLQREDPEGALEWVRWSLALRSRCLGMKVGEVRESAPREK